MPSRELVPESDGSGKRSALVDNGFGRVPRLSVDSACGSSASSSELEESAPSAAKKSFPLKPHQIHIEHEDK